MKPLPAKYRWCINAALLLTLVSCSKGDKDKDPMPANPAPTAPALDPTGRIATIKQITATDSLVHTLYYNAAGNRVDSVATAGNRESIRRIVYGPGYKVVRLSFPGIPGDVEIDSFFYDGAGTLTGGHAISSFGFGSRTGITYNAAGQMEQIVATDETGQVTNVTTYAWSNGDLVRIEQTQNTQVFELTYGTEINVPGDPFYISSLLDYGDLNLPSKHLLKSARVVGGNDFPPFNYVFAGGRIVSYSYLSDEGKPQVATLTYAN